MTSPCTRGDPHTDVVGFAAGGLWEAYEQRDDPGSKVSSILPERDSPGCLGPLTHCLRKSPQSQMMLNGRRPRGSSKEPCCLKAASPPSAYA